MDLTVFDIRKPILSWPRIFSDSKIWIIFRIPSLVMVKVVSDALDSGLKT